MSDLEHFDHTRWSRFVSKRSLKYSIIFDMIDSNETLFYLYYLYREISSQMRCLLPQETSMFLSGVRSFKWTDRIYYPYKGDTRLCHTPNVQLFFSIETQDCRSCDTKQGVRYHIWLTKIRVTDMVINKYVTCNTCNKRVVMLRNGFPCMDGAGVTPKLRLDMFRNGFPWHSTEVNSKLRLDMFRNGFPWHSTEVNSKLCLDMFRNGFPWHSTEVNSKLRLDMFRSGFPWHSTEVNSKLLLDMFRNGFPR